METIEDIVNDMTKAIDAFYDHSYDEPCNAFVGLNKTNDNFISFRNRIKSWIERERCIGGSHA